MENTSIELSEEVRNIINAPDSVKVLTTTNSCGIPHVVFKDSLHINGDGYIEYLELIESSQTNKNMVHSIWFHKTIAISVKNGNRSFQIKGVPYRALIAGREFEARYSKVWEELKTDLSTVWLIEPLEVLEETFEKRRADEETAHPILKHLDLISEKHGRRNSIRKIELSTCLFKKENKSVSW